jgi:hypothetical protein
MENGNSFINNADILTRGGEKSRLLSATVCRSCVHLNKPGLLMAFNIVIDIFLRL